MSRTPTFALALLLVSPLLAQDPGQAPDFSPAKEVAKFDLLLGHWKGSGTVTPEAGVPPMPWTAHVTAKKVLGGHFVREEMVVDMGEQSPGPMLMKTLYGWSRENQRFGAWGISNQGTANEVEVHWDGNTLTTVQAMKVQGQPVVERWITDYGKDSYTVVGERAVGTAEWQTYVKGKFERTTEAGQAADASVAFMVDTAVQAEMDKVAGMAGNYRFKGSMIPMPGAEAMEISGTESVSMIYGGSICEWSTKGDPTPAFGSYEAWGAMAWDPNENCYVQLWASNMGECMKSKAWLAGDKMIATGEMLQFGQPTVMRHVLQLDENGGFKQVRVHQITGTHDPICAFQGTYTKQD